MWIYYSITFMLLQNHKSVINMIGRFQLSACRSYTVHTQNRVLTWLSQTADNPAMELLERKLSLAPPNSLPRTPTAQSHCLQTTCEKLFERKVAQKGLMGTRFCSGGKTTAGQNFLIMWTILHSSFFRIFFNESLCQPESSLSTSCS